jgi:hypothetical protein
MLILGLCTTPAPAATPNAPSAAPDASAVTPESDAGPHAATPEEARRAYDAGNFSDAMGAWAELSREGNAEAEFGLGLMYDLGNGIRENPQTALFWYRMAAEAGVPSAAFNVGAMYDSGRGVPRSSAEAATWYAKAAALGHLRAQYNLGLMYEQGDGVPRNRDAARVWLQEAANGGLPAAASRLKSLEVSPPDRPVGPPTSVTLVFPARNASLLPAGDNPTVALVWMAPAQSQPVRYEVKVRELDGPALTTIVTASVMQTATVVRLPAKPDFYVWNVDAVGQDGSHAASDWNRFSIGAPPRPEQSIASAPDGPEPAH